MMESKMLIDRYCRTRAPPAIAKEKKRLPRSGDKIEGRRAEPGFLKNDRNIFITTTRHPSADAAHNIFPLTDSPILSPETSIALDNAERVVQNALLEIKQLNAAQCRDRTKDGICLVYEPSFEDEDDQLLYVRERVAAKLYAIDSGIEPVQVVGSMRNNASFMLDLTSNADHVASRVRSLKKDDGKLSNNTASELKETRGERTSSTAVDCITVASSDKKSTHMDSQIGKEGRLPSTAVQKKLEGFSIQTGTPVNIERELTAQKLQDIHISPDTSFVQDAPNVGTYRFQYQLGSTIVARKNRQKIVKIDTDKEEKDRTGFQSCASQDKESVEFSPTAEIKETVAQSETPRTDIPHFSARIESRPIQEQTVYYPKENGMTKTGRHDANSIIPTGHNNDRPESRNRSIAENEFGETTDYFRNRKEENAKYEKERYRNIEIHFKDILENYSERGDRSMYQRNPSSVNTKFLDPSIEDAVPALDEANVYQPSIAELDTIINAHNRAIKRIARGVKRVEQFLSDNKIAQYRNAGNKTSKEYTFANLYVSNKGERNATEIRVPSCLPKQRKSMRSNNLSNQRKPGSRNNAWAPGKAMQLEQPRTLEAQNEILSTNNHYKITDTLKEANKPKAQLRNSNREYIERTMSNEFSDNRECFTEDISPPPADTSESIYTDDDVKIKNILDDKAHLSPTFQSRLQNSQENDECKALESNDYPAFVHRTGTATLKEMLLKMKDCNKTTEQFRTSFQNIETESVRKLFETEFMKKEMNPEIIRSVIKNLEAYVRDLQDVNADPTATDLMLKNGVEDFPIQEDKGELIPPLAGQQYNSIEKQPNESQADGSLSSKKVTNSVKTTIEENLSNKSSCDNKKGISSDNNISSLSCKKTVSLPKHESSRIDNKIGRLISSNIKSLEEISFIKANEDCSNDRHSIQDTKISLSKKQTDSQDIKSLQISEQNSNGIKPVSWEEKASDSRIDGPVLTKEGSPRDCAGEPLSSSADSLQDCPSLSASSNGKQTSNKSSNKIPASPSIISKSVSQDLKVDRHCEQAETSLSRNIDEARQDLIGNKSQHTNGDECKQAQPLSEASHSEGEICLSSSCSFSLGEVRRVKTDSRASNYKRNYNESNAIFVTHPVQTWNESSDSQSESPGQI